MSPTPLQDVSLEAAAPGTTVVVFSGEHDLATRDEVKELLSGAVESNDLVIADFSDAQFVDGSVLRTVVDVERQAKAQGRTLRLALGTASIVHRAFEVCGVFDAIDHSPTREQALAKGR